MANPATATGAKPDVPLIDPLAPKPGDKPASEGVLGEKKVETVVVNQQKIQTQKGCDPWFPLKVAAIALAIVTLVAGIVGLLVYIGQLNISLTAVGVMTPEIGLYTMLGGFGTTFIISVLYGINYFLSRSKASTEPEASQPWCCGTKTRTTTLIA